MFDLGLPFFVVTFIVASISISIKTNLICQILDYPALGFLLYYMPFFFFEDCGHIRHSIGSAICILSFKFMKSRNLLMFLFLIYIALGFHKTSIVFLPAYWIVKIPMNSKRIFFVIISSIILSPFKIYRSIEGFIENIAPQDVSEGFEAYVNDSVFGSGLEFGLTDIVKIILIILMILYDKKACEKINYYEYVRNLAVFGLCLFYIFREARIFALRLPGFYLFYLNVFILPCIVFALQNTVKKFIQNGVIIYSILFYFNFSRNAPRISLTRESYKNILFLK